MGSAVLGSIFCRAEQPRTEFSASTFNPASVLFLE